MAAILLNSPLLRHRFRRQRIFKVRVDPLDAMDDVEILQRYRFGRYDIYNIVNMLPGLERPTQRSQALTPLEQVLVALRFYGTGSMQLVVADAGGVSQPSVSRAVTSVTEGLIRLAPHHITMPTTDRELLEARNEIHEINGFPGVTGLIDGTHIRIQAPHQNEEVFVNRKGYHSINLQVVMSGSGIILDIVADWPGSTNDARILAMSGLHAKFSSGAYRGLLLGDSGYPLKTWLFTPHATPVTRADDAYNRSHRKTRNVIERGFGTLKRRFACLHNEMRLHPQKACKISVACAVLHNIAKRRGVPMPAGDHDRQEEHGEAEVQPERQNRAIAQAARQAFINEHFS